MPRILVVEDERVTQHLIGGLLEAEGYEVVTASEGARGLQEIARQPVDLVLVDIWMPGMNGLDFLRALRALPAAPPAVVITADDTPETLLGAIREQTYRYVHKPVDPEVLLEIVRTSLEAKSTRLSIEVVSARPNWVELLVPCDHETADRIQEFMARLDTDLPKEVRDSIGTAFSEMLRNAIEWGGKLDPDRMVRISYLRAKRMLLYRIADPGTGFAFDDLSHAAVSHPDDPTQHTRVREEKGMRAGGYGILMTRALVDELLYNEAQNEVVLVKYLD